MEIAVLPVKEELGRPYALVSHPVFLKQKFERVKTSTGFDSTTRELLLRGRSYTLLAS